MRACVRAGHGMRGQAGGYDPCMLGAHQDTQAPDLFEPIEGWRTWNTQVNYGRQVLVSPDQGTVWPHRPGLYMTALCHHRTAKARAGCNCGINAYAEAEQLGAGAYKKAQVWGRVGLWGEVQKYVKGHRGECAAPLELYVRPGVKNADQVAAGLAATYGIACSVKAMPAQQSEYADESSDVVSKRMWWIVHAVMALVVGAVYWHWWGSGSWIADAQAQAASADLGAKTVDGTSFYFPTGVVLSLAAAVSVVAASWQSSRRLLIASLAVVFALLSLSMYLDDIIDDMPGASSMNSYVLRDELKLGGKPKTITATQKTKAAFIRAFGGIENGDCDTRGGNDSIQVCRTDGTVKVTKLKRD